MTFSQFLKPRYRLVEEEHALRDSSASEVVEVTNPKKEGPLPLTPPCSVGQDTQSGQGASTGETKEASKVLTDVPSVSTPSAKNLWRAYRVAGYQRLILSLLQRGGCETSIELALLLLRDMALKEHLTMHQSQVRSLLHCAILNDQAHPVTSSDRNQNPDQESDSLYGLKSSGKDEG